MKKVTKTTKKTSKATSSAKPAKVTKSSKPSKSTKASKRTSPVKSVAVKPMARKTYIQDTPTWIKVVAIILILLGYAVYRFWGIAKVNDVTISRLEYIKAMERQVGSTTLDNLITESLIEAEAKKQNFVVDEKKIDDEIATISAQIIAQGQTIEEALKAENITLDEVRRQYALQQMVSGLGKGTPEVTEAEIDAYIAENTDSIPTTLGTEEVRTMVRSQLESQEANMNISAWLESLKADAEIVRY